ncbi:MAG: HD domain-containing protein [Candidatus Nanoarchaeia archaeon]
MDYQELIDFYKEIEGLKRTMRYSQAGKSVQEPVAGHSWKAILMANQLASQLEINVDIEHVMKILLVHDLPEYKDEYDVDSSISQRDEQIKFQKASNEEAVMTAIRNNYSFGPAIYDLWKEYEDGETREAKYAKAIDKLEAQTHLLALGGEHFDDAEHCIHVADKAIANFPELLPFADHLKQNMIDAARKAGHLDNRNI